LSRYADTMTEICGKIAKPAPAPWKLLVLIHLFLRLIRVNLIRVNLIRVNLI
jgi:hypothetical protein